MKSFIQTFVVFLALNLVMGSSALAEKPHETEDVKTAEKDMDAAKEQMQAAKDAMKEAGRKMKEAGKNIKEAAHEETTLLLKQLADLAGTRTYSGTPRVLVVPTADTNAEELATIMEDMSVMSRIFDRKLADAHMISGVGYGGGGGYPAAGYGRRGYGDYAQYRGYGGYGGYGGQATEGIFLDGYGALFLMKVNFPLSGPAQTQKEEKTEEPGDRVWEETKRQIYSMEDVRTLKRRRRVSTTRPTAKYDAEKVEDLKTKVIKALKHAANIRNLKPNDWVILTVIGERQRARVIRAERIEATNQIVVETEDKMAFVFQGSMPADTGVSAPGVLTIRVRKSGIDIFAKGDMDFDEFREEVQILTY